MVARDVARALGGLASTLRVAFREPPPTPCVAILEAPTTARARTPSSCRLRVYNPSTTARTITTRVHGERDDLPSAGFDLHWTQELPAGAVAERWLTTDWMGAAEIRDAPPAAAPFVVAGRTSGHWTIDATIDGAPDRLRIQGSLGV